MTQRLDSVFTNRVQNEPVANTTQSRLRDIQRSMQKDARRERLQMIAVILMNLSEMSEARDELLDN